jgi:hypothetical protein
MIEVVSHPADLASWDPQQEPFYLELYGETRPLVDVTYAEVRPAGTDDGAEQTTAATPIYQYWWTIGHTGDPQQLDDLWNRLDGHVAARVYLYFPLDKGWRIKELVATVKYLQPFYEQTTFWNKLTDDWQHFASPAIAGAGSLAGLAPNPAVAGAGSILSAIAKLQINSVPQVPGFEWSVGKVTTPWQDVGVVQGVMWTLPKKMFTELGGRLTGSLALSFIPSQRQQGAEVGAAAPTFGQGAVLAHAVVYGPGDRHLWAPAQNRFVTLHVHPRAADVPQPPAPPPHPVAPNPHPR